MSYQTRVPFDRVRRAMRPLVRLNDLGGVKYRYNMKVDVKADKTDVDIANVTMSMNPFDKIVVEGAVRLKEVRVVAKLIAVSGVLRPQGTLRAALAIGVDRAILIESNEQSQPLAVAKLLKAGVNKELAQLVILDKQANDDSNQTGQCSLVAPACRKCDVRLEGRRGGRQGNGHTRSGWAVPKRCCSSSALS
jgi:Electron transfer flavoprotein domain